jgi:hypothetical protein
MGWEKGLKKTRITTRLFFILNAACVYLKGHHSCLYLAMAGELSNLLQAVTQALSEEGTVEPAEPVGTAETVEMPPTRYPSPNFVTDPVTDFFWTFWPVPEEPVVTSPPS